MCSFSYAQHGNTALIWTVMKGHLEMVKGLLQSGVDKDQRNRVS
jgi:ankyrin repeat protein